MKCDNCPAFRTDGCEYPESYCAAGVSEDSKMCTDGGCRYPLKAIRQRLERRDKMEAHQYDGVEDWYKEEQAHAEAMRHAINIIFGVYEVLLCYKSSTSVYLPYNDGNATTDIAEGIYNEYRAAENSIQKTYCERCQWKDRYQKCTSCRRNTRRRDLFEEKKGVEQ